MFNVMIIITKQHPKMKAVFDATCIIISTKAAA
jgi:hypothetical protein